MINCITSSIGKRGEGILHIRGTGGVVGSHLQRVSRLRSKDIFY